MDDPQSRKEDIDLSSEEDEAANDRQPASARVVHEAVRRSGDEELDRPALSLIWSGFAGGIAISTSLLGQALFAAHLPETPWKPLVESFGYTLGDRSIRRSGPNPLPGKSPPLRLRTGFHPDRKHELHQSFFKAI